jgi:hypothetical protein
MPITAFLLVLTALVGRQEHGWRYVVPPEGDALRRPSLLAVPLASEKPDELVVNAKFRGQWQRYGSLRFGDPDSTRVT